MSDYYAYLQGLEDSLGIIEIVQMKGEYASEETTTALQEIYQRLERLIANHTGHSSK